MGVSLIKGQKIDLTKGNAGLKQLLIGLGWDPIKQTGTGIFNKKPHSIDLDSSVFMLKNDKIVHMDDIIYFGNLKSRCGGIIHNGDNLTGGGDGDDEQIIVNLNKIPSDVNKLVFVINIYGCKVRKQDFGMINNAFIRVVDNANNTELIKFNLTEGYTGKTALILAEVYRYNNEWKFAAIGEGTMDTTIDELASKYRD